MQNLKVLFCYMKLVYPVEDLKCQHRSTKLKCIRVMKFSLLFVCDGCDFVKLMLDKDLHGAEWSSGFSCLTSADTANSAFISVTHTETFHIFNNG